ncbi:hypothetical protein ACFL6M_05095 [Candidatus Eisenbacteria bacterium]|uniref:Heme-binding protein n=1 Tax=Eiseniibacteriota bacterium TaxID=2212470 RepID=A0ABV6YKT8_UNCEI
MKNPANVTRAIGETLRRLVVQEGFQLPLHCVVLAKNGSVMAVRYSQGEPGYALLAQAAVDGVFRPPVNIMFVDATGLKAMRMTIESSNKEPLYWCFDHGPRENQRVDRRKPRPAGC